MKKKLRTILRDTILYHRTDLLFYSLILLLCTAILSMSLFFTGGNAVEKSLASSLNLTLSYRNNSYFSYSSDNTLYLSNPSLNQRLSEMFIHDLQDLCNDSDLAYANYSIAIDIRHPSDNGWDETYLYGLRSSEYFSDNSITLEGCTAEDLVSGTVILPSSEKEKGMSVNDTYPIYAEEVPGKAVAELKVIGFYTDKRWSLESEDPVLIHTPPFTANDTILSLLEKQPAFYGYFETEEGTVSLSQLQIANMEFHPKDIDSYTRFVKKFNSFSMEENSKFSRICSEGGGVGSLALQTEVSTFGSILKSIERIKLIYEFIFIGIWILLLVTLFSFISFLQKKNSYDISIHRLLGESRKKTVLYYIRYYLISSIPALLIGEPLGYLCAKWMSGYLYRNSLTVQQQMSAITGTRITAQTDVILSSPSLSRILLIVPLITAVMILIIISASLITTLLIEKQNLKDQARGKTYE